MDHLSTQALYSSAAAHPLTHGTYLPIGPAGAITASSVVSITSCVVNTINDEQKLVVTELDVIELEGKDAAEVRQRPHCPVTVCIAGPHAGNA